ncbi:putative hydro-lyase [Salicibibacter halophilus]|uniref:Putative hydro-lyase EPH95_07900 n=1 Tax=Salicibibacter halophilus TaxID=2502791 RepID=A0A514LN85_9BACI|nr:putative hydro-lyase [Salicibibacter halophilus]QDI93055.1 putative hydro-lyase [Salicibibacter halophilus]
MEKIRCGEMTSPTSGHAGGFTQANLVILKKDLAFEFLLFSQRNPKSCPVLDVSEAGSSVARKFAPEADLRMDVPKYHIYRDGKFAREVMDITEYWQDDMVAFLLGCSFTFEEALIANGIGMRHNDEGCNVPMYKTNIQTEPAGIFHGPMVVSMRPIPKDHVVRAVQVTSRFPDVHGAPIHIGDPAFIGISDLDEPDYGDAVSINENEVPVFWACGVTPQSVAMESKPELMITHAPGHMFITDVRNERLGVI